MKVYGELQNADLESLASAPASPSRGRLYYDTVLSALRYYNGSSWIAISASSLAITTTRGDIVYHDASKTTPEIGE